MFPRQGVAVVGLDEVAVLRQHSTVRVVPVVVCRLAAVLRQASDVALAVEREPVHLPGCTGLEVGHRDELPVGTPVVVGALATDSKRSAALYV